jgi:hypothetical protein
MTQWHDMTCARGQDLPKGVFDYSIDGWMDGWTDSMLLLASTVLDLL